MIKFWSFIPTFLKRDNQLVNFFTSVKERYEGYELLIDRLQKASDIDGEFYKYIGNSFGAFYDENMFERQERQSIYESIVIARNPFVFNVWKPIIDRIANSDCDIYLGDVYAEPAFYGTAIYGLDFYAEGEEVEELDVDDATLFGEGVYGVDNYGVPTVDKGYGHPDVIYGETAYYSGSAKEYIITTIQESRLPNIYIDLKINKNLITENLIDALRIRLSIFKGCFFIINVGVFEIRAFRTYLRIR